MKAGVVDCLGEAFFVGGDRTFVSGESFLDSLKCVHEMLLLNALGKRVVVGAESNNECDEYDIEDEGDSDCDC